MVSFKQQRLSLPMQPDEFSKRAQSYPSYADLTAHASNDIQITASHHCNQAQSNTVEVVTFDTVHDPQLSRTQNPDQSEQLPSDDSPRDQDLVLAAGLVASRSLKRRRSLTPQSFLQDFEVETGPEPPRSRSSQAPSQLSEDFNMPDASTVTAMRDLLKINLIYINQDLARAQGQVVIIKALAILDGKRGSDWSGPKAVMIQRTIHYNKDENEATFLCKLFHVLLATERKVTAATLDSDREYIDRAWDKDYLREKWDTLFVGDDLPTLKIPNENQNYWKAILAQFPKMTNPKPDISWSVDGDAYEADLSVKVVIDAVHCQLCGRNAYHTFFVSECKCINCSIEEAENGCMKDGAIMNQHARRCRFAFEKDTAKAFKFIDEPTPDTDSFVFSMAIAPSEARIFVNWILVHPNGFDTHHMHHLRTYRFKEESELAQLHYDIDNILDWGVGARKDAIDKMVRTSIETKAVPTLPSTGMPANKRKRQTGDET
ncbi:uncharacterized protein KY384_007999 [Bacidia gigantensis]|uniref:uncharacterized protein n=1 Tax=Bacidia gigantensis TaxID=2732470 RepID=UPI001D048DCD|nr:uncharacterized protein KY384_007999 [Bacidia gigantensis]KAG8527255.1 hypothetical protein KY384_007999 [Bacidia gigantensis]